MVPIQRIDPVSASTMLYAFVGSVAHKGPSLRHANAWTQPAELGSEVCVCPSELAVVDAECTPGIWLMTDCCPRKKPNPPANSAVGTITRMALGTALNGCMRSPG